MSASASANDMKEDSKPTAVDGHLKHVTKGIDKIAVNHDEEHQNNIIFQKTAIKHTTGGKGEDDSRKTHSPHSFAVTWSHGGINVDKARYPRSETPEEDCDRSQSSILSGASWESKRGRRSSFKSRAGVGKAAYSPRWMDQEQHEHRRLASDSGYGSLTDDGNAAVKASDPGHEQNMSDAHPADAHDSHEEGYLFHSEGYPPSVKSDIATVCSGSVVEDVSSNYLISYDVFA